MLPKELDCPFCKVPLDARSMVERIEAYTPSSHLYCAGCPACQQTIEFKVYFGAIEVGYSYWSGAMHFESVARLSVRGLRVAGVDGELELAGVQIWPRPPPSAS